MTVKFYYQCTAKLANLRPEVCVDGFVSGPSPEQCLQLAHDNTKKQLIAAIRLADSKQSIDVPLIQTRMQIFSQIQQPIGLKVVPCA